MVKNKVRSVKKLLLNKREDKKILHLLTTKGLRLFLWRFFNKRTSKVKFGVGIGKKKYDKRE